MNYSNILLDLDNLINLESITKKNKINEIENILISNLYIKNNKLTLEENDKCIFNKSKNEIESKGFVFSNIKIPLKDRKLKIFYDIDYYPSLITKNYIYNSNDIQIEISQYISDDTKKNKFEFGHFIIKHKLFATSMEKYALSESPFSSEYINGKREAYAWNSIIQAAYELSTDKTMNKSVEAQELLLIKYDINLNNNISYKNLFECFYEFYTILKKGNFKNKIQKKI